MILKLLIADDDIEVLQTMATMLKGHAELYEVAGLAEDGVQALALIRETHPDVLITDITMPQMDGLELISEAKKLFPSLRTLLITCHEEFRYAKEAIQLDVDDYLVKYTMTEAELLSRLEDISEKISRQRLRNDSFERISGEIYRSREQFKERYISAVAQRRSQEAAELRKKAPMYGVELPGGSITLTGFILSDFESAVENSILDDGQLLLFSLANIITDVFSGKSPFQFIMGRTVYLILPAEHAVERPELLAKTLRYAENVLAIRPNAIYLPAPFDAEDMADGVNKILECRAACFYKEPGSILETGAFKFAAPTRHDDWYEEFHQNIFDPEQLRNTFLKIKTELAESQYSPEHVLDVLGQLNITMNSAMRFHGGKLPKIAVTGETFLSSAAEVGKNLNHWVEYMSLNGCATGSEDVRLVVRYVSEHLDSGISLEKVASVIYKNSSYLSRLFKRETGLTFSDYLTRKRIEKARWLLTQTSMSIDDIAQSVGIPNTQYFYKFFKRETGKKPGDLRR